MHMFLHPISLAAMLVAMCFKKKFASLWRNRSTDVTKGVNVPRLSSNAFLYTVASSSLEPLCPKFVFDAGVMVRLCQ